MKFLMKIIIGIVIVVAILIFAKNMIAKIAVENGVHMATGLELKVKSFDVSLAKTYIAIEEMRLYNPKGYRDKIMADIPEIYVDYDLPAILKGKIHVPEIRIHLNEFVVVKNANGELNIDKLKAVEEGKKKEPAEKPKKEGKAIPIQIDRIDFFLNRNVITNPKIRSARCHPLIPHHAKLIINGISDALIKKRIIKPRIPCFLLSTRHPIVGLILCKIDIGIIIRCHARRCTASQESGKESNKKESLHHHFILRLLEVENVLKFC